MIKPKKRTKIAWHGLRAEFVRKILAAEVYFSHPAWVFGNTPVYSLDGYLSKTKLKILERLQQSGTLQPYNWGEEDCPRLNRLRRCTSVLLRVQLHNWCYFSWFCPHCYGREAWKLSRYLKKWDGGFQVKTEQFEVLSIADAESLWAVFAKVRRQELRNTSSSLVWQELSPNGQFWRFRRSIILPGEQSWNEILPEVISGFSYSHGWLISEPAAIAAAMEFMAKRRGRSVSGVWKTFFSEGRKS